MRVAAVGIALIFALVAAAALLAPTLIERAGLRQQLVQQFAAQLGAQVELGALRVSLLPLPHVVLDQLRFVVVPTVDAAVDSAAVYPRLQALLAGNLRFDVSITGARVRLHIRGEAAGKHAARSDNTLGGLRDALAAAAASASSVAATRAAGLTVRLTHSAVTITPPDRSPVTVTDIHGTIRLPPEQLGIDLAAGSNLWEQATLRAAIDADSLRGDASLVLTGLRPQALTGDLRPAGFEIGSGTANLSVHVSANGLDTLGADVEVMAPSFELRRGAEQLTLQGVHVNAGATVDRESLSVTLRDVRLTAPPVQLAGTLAVNRTTPRAHLEIAGEDLDVAQAHEAALFFAGTNPTAQAIFNILRSGTVPRLTLQTEGRTPADLGSLDAMRIRGALVGGTVRLPGNGLELDDVSGDVSIANGVLVGEHVAGRLGNSRAHDGNVRVGLTDASRELSVSTALQADVRDLPGVLRRVVANDTLTRVLERLTDVQGRAEGQFTLGGTTDAATAAVDVSQLSVSARVRDLDQTLQIDGGQFHYDPGAVTATGLAVTAGNSMLSQLSVRADTTAAVPSINVSCASGRIALGEVYPRMAASGWLPASEWTPAMLAGTLAVDSVRIGGPAATPSDWRVELSGAVRNLDIDSPRLRQVSAVRFPLSLSNLRLTRAPAATALSMGVTTADGLNAMLDLLWDPAGLNLRRLSLRDAHSDAKLSLLLKQREFDLTFAGKLDTASLKELLADEYDVPRSMRGDFEAHIFLDQPARSTAKGQLELAHVPVPLSGNLRMHLIHAGLQATGGQMAVDAEADVSDGQYLHASGVLRLAADALIADLDVSAGQIDWARLAALLPAATEATGEATSKATSAPATALPLPVRGKVRVSVESFTYAGFTRRPVRAVVELARGRPSITVTQAHLCGIATPGTIALTEDGVSVRFTPTAKNQPLDQVLLCLFNESGRITGRSNLSAQVETHGRVSDMGVAARGHVQLDATNGRFYQGGLIEKILAVSSVGFGSWNILADLTDDGLPYDTIDVKADLRDGKLVLTEATVDAPSMKMVAEGNIDVSAGSIDLTLLAAPLKTADTVVGRIPILGSVLGGNLLTIPIKVKGPLQEPTVTPLDPADVGSGLLRVMTRIVKLPLRLLNPFRPSDKKP